MTRKAIKHDIGDIVMLNRQDGQPANRDEIIAALDIAIDALTDLVGPDEGSTLLAAAR